MCISILGRSRNSLVGSASIARPSIKTSFEVRRPRQRPAFPSAQGTGCTNSSAARQYGVSSKLIGLTLRHAELGLQRIRPVRRQILEDRKSVVEGKSVSVRVDLEGRRIFKKKNTNDINNTKSKQ